MVAAPGAALRSNVARAVTVHNVGVRPLGCKRPRSSRAFFFASVKAWCWNRYACRSGRPMSERSPTAAFSKAYVRQVPKLIAGSLSATWHRDRLRFDRIARDLLERGAVCNPHMPPVPNLDNSACC